MNSTEKYLEKKLYEYSKIFEASALFSNYSLSCRNFDAVSFCHSNLCDIYERITALLNELCSADEIKLVEEQQFDKLPEYLVSLKSIEAYRKIIALTYSNFLFDDKRNILLNKMSLELNSENELPYLNIAQILANCKKYPEAIKLINYLSELRYSAPVLLFMAKMYSGMKRYDKAIANYNSYLEIYDRDKKAKNSLNKIYDEVFS